MLVAYLNPSQKKKWGSFPWWSLDTWTINTVIKGTSSMDVISVSMCYSFHMNDFKHNPTHKKKVDKHHVQDHLLSAILNIFVKLMRPSAAKPVPWPHPRSPPALSLGVTFRSHRPFAWILGDPSKRSLRRSQRRGYVDFCWEHEEISWFFHDLHETKKEENL